MASTPFVYQGTSFTIDDQGNITNASGVPVGGGAAADIGLWQAAAQAQSAEPAPTAPAPALPATPPRAAATADPSAPPDVGGPVQGPPSSTPGLPARPPRGSVGSAVEERQQLQTVQGQIAEVTAIPAGDRTNSQNSSLDALSRQATALTQTIDRIETPAPGRAVAGAAAGPNDAYIVSFNPDGTLKSDPNPNHTGQVNPQVVTHGNQTFVITPPTKDELAANPSAPPHTTIAYTDQDAKALADRQTAVSEANSKIAGASQAATAWAAQAANELATRVSKGEDAASVRAEQLQKSNELHQAWVEADGDARRAQTDLANYNTERHQAAADTLGQATLEQTRVQQARQDATTIRGQDIQAASNKYSTDVGASTARMNAGNTLLQNSLSALAEINKSLPPGSDLAGKALQGMMAYGQKFLAGMSAPPGGTTSPDDVAARQVADSTTAPPADQPVSPSPWTRADTSQTPADSSGLAPAGTAGTVAAGAPNYMGTSSVASPDYAAASINNPTLGPTPPPPPPDPFATASINDPSRGLAAQNTASHQANMAAPIALHPDGSPIAGMAALQQAWANRAGGGA